MKDSLLQLFLRAEITHETANLVLTFSTGIQRSEIEPYKGLLVQNEEIYDCTDEDYIPFDSWEGSDSKVQIRFLRASLRNENFICRKSISEYISRDLRDRYLGFMKGGIIIITDISYFPGGDSPKPQELIDAENCCAIFQKLMELSDLISENNLYFFKDKPYVVPSFLFDEQMVQRLSTSYEAFYIYFDGKNDDKKACFKSELIEVIKRCQNVKDRARFIFQNFDEIFKHAEIAYDHFCARNGADRLSAKLQKETFDLIERVQGLMEVLKSEIIVLATSAIGLSQLDLSSILSFKNLAILVTIIIVDWVFQIVLSNGKRSISQLVCELGEHEESLKRHYDGKFDDTIEKKFKELQAKLERTKSDFKIANILLWTPLIICILLLISYKIFFADVPDINPILKLEIW